MNNNFINNSNDSSINLDKNILVDALKHTSEIMIALSSKVYIIEEEIKNINSNLLSFVKENKQLKEALKKKDNEFIKLYETNQNITKIYDNKKDDNKKDDNKEDDNKEDDNKEDDKKIIISGNVVNNRKKNNLFIRKI